MGRYWPSHPVDPALSLPFCPGSDHTFARQRHHPDVTGQLGPCSLGLVAPMMLLPAWSSVPVLLPGWGDRSPAVPAVRR